MSVNCCTAFIAICMATLLRFILVRLNRKLDEGMAVNPVDNSLEEATGPDGIPIQGAKHGFRYRV
jgi:hypothetical protein